MVRKRRKWSGKIRTSLICGLVLSCLVSGGLIASVFFDATDNFPPIKGTKSHIRGVTLGPVTESEAVISWKEEIEGGWLSYGTDPTRLLRMEIPAGKNHVTLKQLTPGRRHYATLWLVVNNETKMSEYQFFTR